MQKGHKYIINKMLTPLGSYYRYIHYTSGEYTHEMRTFQMFRPFVIKKDNPCMREVSVMRPITNDVYNIIFHNKSWAVTDHQMILGCSHLDMMGINIP